MDHSYYLWDLTNDRAYSLKKKDNEKLLAFNKWGHILTLYMNSSCSTTHGNSVSPLPNTELKCRVLQKEASFWLFDASICFLAENCFAVCPVWGAVLTVVFLEEYVVECWVCGFHHNICIMDNFFDEKQIGMVLIFDLDTQLFLSQRMDFALETISFQFNKFVVQNVYYELR